MIIFSDEDILADSDDDDDDDDEIQDILMDSNAQTERSKKKAHKKDEKYIYENADTIVDLADVKAISSIACKYLHRIFDFCIRSKFFLMYSTSLQHQNQPNTLVNQLVLIRKSKIQTVDSRRISVVN